MLHKVLVSAMMLAAFVSGASSVFADDSQSSTGDTVQSSPTPTPTSKFHTQDFRVNKKFSDAARAEQMKKFLERKKMEEEKKIEHQKQMQEKRTANLACVGTAVDKRENALIAGFNTLASSIVSAYQAREVALKDAWSKTNTSDLRSAVQAASQAFNQSVKSARMNWNTAQQNAWQSFRNDSRSCGITSEADSGSQKQELGL